MEMGALTADELFVIQHRKRERNLRQKLSCDAASKGGGGFATGMFSVKKMKQGENKANSRTKNFQQPISITPDCIDQFQ